MASVVGLGTWHANWTGPSFPIADESAFIRTVHAALDAGINYIDTAPGYINAENLVGKALQGRREHVILCTKCGVITHNNPYSYRATDRGDGAMICLASEAIRFEIEESLRRLKTDYIDLYLTHVPDPNTPVEETMSAMESLRKEGKIRAIGCCDASIADMDRYRSIGRLDVTQRGYHMLHRDAEKSVFPYVIDNGISFVAYQSLAQGLLAGAFGPKHVFAPGDWRLPHPLFALECRRHIQAFWESVRPVAQDLHLTMSQLVIAWTVAQPGCTHTPVSALEERQAIENAVAARIALSETDMADIQVAMERYLKDYRLS